MKNTIRSIRRGTGKPLVLLHPFPLSNSFWESLAVPAGFQLILPNFPGFGDSTLSNPKTIEEAARDLAEHLDELGLANPFILGGISMGGYWAMEFLRQFQNRVEGLLFISTRAGLDLPEAL